MIPGLLGVIPARLASSRLPRKPLYPLASRPLIEWVWRRVNEANVFQTLVIATDSEEVAQVARGFGARVELTRVTHASGTDRVAEVAARGEFFDYPWILNVQGDEPFVRADDLLAAARLVREEEWPIGTLAAPLASSDELRDPAAVKVVRADDGSALYFSRAPIPYPREGWPSDHELQRGPFLRHIGIYAYRREALLRWVSLAETALERAERLEQLRPLAAGIRIGVDVVAPVAAGVDTPEDARRAESRLRHLTTSEEPSHV